MCPAVSWWSFLPFATAVRGVCHGLFFLTESERTSVCLASPMAFCRAPCVAAAAAVLTLSPSRLACPTKTRNESPPFFFWCNGRQTVVYMHTTAWRRQKTQSGSAVNMRFFLGLQLVRVARRIYPSTNLSIHRPTDRPSNTFPGQR